VVTALHASAKLLCVVPSSYSDMQIGPEVCEGLGVQKFVSAVDVLCDWVTVSGYIILVYSWLPRLT